MKLLLDQGELLDLGKNSQGLRIVCQMGSCWLTQAGDYRDYILREGEQFEASRAEHLLLYATGPCQVQLLGERSTRDLLSPTAVLMQKISACGRM